MTNFTLLESIHDTLQKESEAILEIKNTFNPDQVNKIYELIRDCKGKIITTGCGTSGAAARKIAHTLNCVECAALFLNPADAVHGALGVVQPNDLVFAFSKGGATTELNNLIPGCKAKGAILIAVTEVENSFIAESSDYIFKLKIENEPDDFNMLATSSTLATIAIFDAICIAITRLRGFTKEQFSIIHPGGKVGERLQGN